MHASNPLNPLEPVAAVVKAVTFPFTAIFVVALCYFINWVTSPGDWWAQWVLFGMVIATLLVWLRALRVIVATAGLAGAGYLVYRWWSRRSATRGADVVDAHPIEPVNR